MPGPVLMPVEVIDFCRPGARRDGHKGAWLIDASFVDPFRNRLRGGFRPRFRIEVASLVDGRGQQPKKSIPKHRNWRFRVPPECIERLMIRESVNVVDRASEHLDWLADRQCLDADSGVHRHYAFRACEKSAEIAAENHVQPALNPKPFGNCEGLLLPVDKTVVERMRLQHELNVCGSLFGK